MEKADFAELKSVQQEKWDTLAGKKVYFGHQSVGFNIMEGLKDLMQEIPAIKLNIRETNNLNDSAAPVFAHSRVGKNENPVSKCDDFRKVIESGVGNKADIAFFKFCYVDITAETDISSTFKYYTETMSALEAKYPKVQFIHCTVPLKAIPTGFKARIKNIIGIPVQENEDNIKRNNFNEILREKYKGSGRLFDLARYEAAGMNGANSIFRSNGQTYSALAEEWTSDGGHLNRDARDMVAKELLLFLLKIK